MVCYCPEVSKMVCYCAEVSRMVGKQNCLLLCWGKHNGLLFCWGKHNGLLFCWGKHNGLLLSWGNQNGLLLSTACLRGGKHYSLIAVCLVEHLECYLFCFYLKGHINDSICMLCIYQCVYLKYKMCINKLISLAPEFEEFIIFVLNKFNVLFLVDFIIFN